MGSNFGVGTDGVTVGRRKMKSTRPRLRSAALIPMAIQIRFGRDEPVPATGVSPRTGVTAAVDWVSCSSFFSALRMVLTTSTYAKDRPPAPPGDRP